MSTWTVAFQPNRMGTQGISLVGVTSVRSEHGLLLFEDAGGEVIYAVSIEVVAYCGNLDHETQQRDSDALLSGLATAGSA